MEHTFSSQKEETIGRSAMRNRLPLLSIIVPVYKTEKLLGHCVDSILSQTYKNLEVLLINDGSPDESGRICEEYAIKDPRVRVVHKAVNAGQAAARNTGLDLARGDLIGFVDSDDFISLEMYERLYTNLTSSGAQISCCGTSVVSNEGAIISYFVKPMNGLLNFNREQALHEHLHNRIITSSLCDKLYVREVFSDVRMIEGMIYEDLEVVPRCLHNARRVVYTYEPLYHYVMTPQSTLRGAFNCRKFELIRAAEMRAKWYECYCPGCLNLAKDTFIEQCLSLIVPAYFSGKCKDELHLALQGIQEAVQATGLNHLRRKTRYMVLLLRLGLPVYAVSMHVYQEVARRIRGLIA